MSQPLHSVILSVARDLLFLSPEQVATESTETTE